MFIFEYIGDKLLEDSFEWMVCYINSDGFFCKVGVVYSIGFKVCYLLL